MQGKVYSNAHDILDILGLAGDLGNGLLYFVSRILGLGASQVLMTTADYGHALHRGGRPAQRDCRRGRAQSSHREEVMIFRPSHFAAVLLFALFASTVFGITQRETPRRMIRYGVYCFVSLSGRRSRSVG